MAAYDKADFWALKARKEGYPARSVYKLMELDAKFRLLRPGFRVLDIGAAPGSWSLWTSRRLDARGFLAAVDLQPLGISPGGDNFLFVQGDLYDKAIQATLAERGPYDLIMSDAAPATSGNRGLDTDRSAAIVAAVLDCADLMLRPGGSVLAKLFMGGAERELLDRMRRCYTSARGFKPQACRSISFETYLVGQGFKSPQTQP